MQTVLQRIQKGLQPNLLPLCLQAQSSRFQKGLGCTTANAKNL